MIPFNLNPAQIEAVNHKNGPLLIAAGAGSGKTKTLTALLATLLADGVNPGLIIAVTFTNKAAEEMKNRVLNLESGIWKPKSGTWNKNRMQNSKFRIPNLPFIGTFHSLGVRILREEARLAGRNEKFSIFDDDDSLRLVKNVVRKLDFATDKYRPAVVAAKISRIKNELSSPKEAGLDMKYAKIFECYEDELMKNNAFDFDDLIEKPVRILSMHPHILEKYRKKFQYLLVDEYQDVNMSQYQLIKLLAGEHKNIFVVGDDAQAIYGFRGSDFRNFLNFERDWPGAKIILLEQNYRSTKTIIAAASALIAKNKMQKPKTLWTENPQGRAIVVKEARDENEEAEWIVKQIESEIWNVEYGIKNNDSQIINSKFQIPSVAVLYRTNAQSRALEQALIEHDIPYEIFGGLRFHARKEVKDITAGLRYALNPRDEISRERIEKTFSRNVSGPLLKRLPGVAKTLSASELIEFFLTSTNYIAYLERNSTNPTERIENVQELMKLAGGVDLPTFLERMSLLQSGDQPQNSRFQILGSKFLVRLTTIHLAKGLEFENVFIAGCNEGLLPHQMSMGSAEEMEEERRLMYVAMTRAKKNLCISFYDLPSRFLGELPPELLEFQGTKALDDEERYISLD